MKYKLLFILVLTFSLTNTVFATVTQEKPNACPSVYAIKAAGFTTMEHHGIVWFAKNNSNQEYDTNAKWNITFYNEDEDNSQNENEARIKAIAALDLITKIEGPVLNDVGWACSYYSDDSSQLHWGMATAY